MKLVLIIFLTVLIKHVHLGLVKNILGTVTEELNKVSENMNSLVSNKHNNGDFETKGKESYNNVGDPFKQSIESVNEHVDDVMKQQRYSSEDYRHSSRDEPSSWTQHTFHSTNNSPESQEYSGHTHFHNHDSKPQYYGSSEEKYSELAFAYNPTTAKTNSWNNDFDRSTKKTSTTESSLYSNDKNRHTVVTTSTTSSYKDLYSNTDNQGFDDSKSNSVNQNRDTKNTLTSGSDGVIITEDNNITSIDQIIFPGKVSSSTEKTCPQGLIITANGNCLKPIVIHMNNTSTETPSSGAQRSAFEGGCLAGYSKTVGGICAEIIYD